MPVAREIYQEGLILPPVRLVRRGRIDRDVLALAPRQRAHARRARRRPDGADRRQSRRRDAPARHRRALRPRAARSPTRAALQDYTERVVRAAIRDDSRRPLRVRRRARRRRVRRSAGADSRGRSTITGDRATIDFTGSDPQVDGQRERELRDDAVRVPLRVPLSGRRRRAVQRRRRRGRSRSSRRQGSIVNARRPAAVAGGNVETSQRITDVVLGALGQALPGSAAGREPGHDEQRDARRRPIRAPAGGSRTTRRWAAAWAARTGLAGPQRRAHAHEQHAQHAGRGDRALPAGADPPVRVCARDSGGAGAAPGGEGSCANTRC